MVYLLLFHHVFYHVLFIHAPLSDPVFFLGHFDARRFERQGHAEVILNGDTICRA